MEVLEPILVELRNPGYWMLSAERSSTVCEVWYSPETLFLDIRFRSGPKIYRYANVEPDCVQEFLNAPSPGAFHHQSIKSVYPCSVILYPGVLPQDVRLPVSPKPVFTGCVEAS